MIRSYTKSSTDNITPLIGSPDLSSFQVSADDCFFDLHQKNCFISGISLFYETDTSFFVAIDGNALQLFQT